MKPPVKSVAVRPTEPSATRWACRAGQVAQALVLGALLVYAFFTLVAGDSGLVMFRYEGF